MKNTILFSLAVFFLCLGFSCVNSTKTEASKIDSVVNVIPDSASAEIAATADTSIGEKSSQKSSELKEELATIYIYNFHVTNRCPSCIAIEEATTKTLNTHFAKELKEGRIKRKIVNVDDDANKAIAEKYEAFGSGLLVVRSYKGRETKADLTGDGFKYAKNKEDKFVEILKKQVEDFLK